MRFVLRQEERNNTQCLVPNKHTDRFVLDADGHKPPYTSAAHYQKTPRHWQTTHRIAPAVDSAFSLLLLFDLWHSRRDRGRLRLLGE